MRRTAVLMAVMCVMALAADNAVLAPQVSAGQRSTVIGRQSPVVAGTDAISIPQMLSYQGRLTDTLGQPVPDGNYPMMFLLYTVPSGGSLFWSENQSVTTKDGLFSVLLGSVTPISSIPDAGAVYLGMTVSGGPELTPRIRIASAAFAYLSARSANADLLQGKDTTGFVRTGQSNSVTLTMITDATVAAADLGQMGASSGQVMKWTGSAWAPRSDSFGGGDNAWVRSSPDSVLFTVRKLGLARGGAGNVLLGDSAFSHVNFGARCSTGNASYCIYPTVGGGRDNSATGSAATVAGGISNHARAEYATIAGGDGNIASHLGATVGGGYYDSAYYFYATVAGGDGNKAGEYYSTVGGGSGNKATGFASGVFGGQDNVASARGGFVGGGESDSAKGTYAAALGGHNNTAGHAATDTGALVAGGIDNTVGWKFSSIGGGEGNSIAGRHSVICGGLDNSVVSNLGTATGYANMVDGVGGVALGYADTVEAGYGFAANSWSRSAHASASAFNGQVTTASSQTRVGVLSKASGTFTIDHPLDPHGKILNHYFIEGPEMLNIYRGSVVLDAEGRAGVNLPDYFDVLNRNPMVQLTGVGTNEVVYVAEDVCGNHFTIGGPARAKVYWQVTGERKDVSAEATRRMMPVEQPKNGPLAGRMLDDDFLVGCMGQLVSEGKADGIGFRTAGGRARYENMKRAAEQR